MKNILRKILLSSFIFCFAHIGKLSAQSRLEIPLVIKEALPAGVGGVARTHSPVKVGVPLLDSDRIADINRLGLTNTTAYQFRVLQRYPSNNIQWVLVDFQADVAANGATTVKLVPGTGNTGGVDLAQVNNSVVTINTGRAQFKIVKNTGILLHEAVANGRHFLQSGQGAVLEASDAAGTVYESRFDRTATTILEENGPVRATIKQTGFLFDQTGTKRFFGYTVRLHFYQGHQYIRAVVTFKNDFLENNQISILAVKGCALRLPTTLQQNSAFRLGTASNVWQGPINGQVALVQGYTDFRRFDESAELEDRLTRGRGVWIRNGATILQNYTGVSQYAAGWASMSSNSNVINFALRAMSGYWAAGFHFKADGTARLQVLSDEEKPGGYPTYMFSYYAHETREFLIDFGGELTAEKLEKELTYPLWGIPPYELLSKTGALLEETKVVNTEEAQQFFRDNYTNSNWSLTNTDETRAGGWLCGPVKMWAWATGGTKGGVPWALIYLTDAYRTGFGGLFLNSYYWSYYTGDLAVLHSANWDFAADATYQVVGAGPTFNGVESGYKKYLEAEHPHWLHLIPFYFLTGDEKIREDIIDCVEMRFDQSYYQRQPGHGKNWQYFRWMIYAIRDFAIAAALDLLPQKERDRNKSALSQFLNDFLYVQEDGTTDQQGWNDQRGFLYEWSSANDGPGRETHYFFVYEVGAMCLSEIYKRFYDIFPNDHRRYHKLRDRLLGLAYFNQREGLPYPSDPGQVYDLPLDRHPGQHGDRGDQVLFLQAFGYQQTGDRAFLERGKYLIPQIMDYQAGERMSELTAQYFINVFNRQDQIKVTYPVVQATKLGNGAYQLTWQKPSLPVQEYILKYADKIIVPNLNFDQFQRTYQFNLAQYVNFWAANEPAISPDPNAASFKITSLDPAKEYRFSLKAFHDATPATSVKPYGDSGPPRKCKIELHNYPNPFTAQTKIKIQSADSWRSQNNTLTIYNLAGQQIFSLADFQNNEIIWDASQQPSGIYIAQLKAEAASSAIKMVLLR